MTFDQFGAFFLALKAFFINSENDLNFHKLTVVDEMVKEMAKILHNVDAV